VKPVRLPLTKAPHCDCRGPAALEGQIRARSHNSSSGPAPRLRVTQIIVAHRIREIFSAGLSGSRREGCSRGLDRHEQEIFTLAVEPHLAKGKADSANKRQSNRTVWIESDSNRLVI
jgi:hypothetical protein